MRDAISDVFAALADQTRRGLYEQLLGHAEGQTATELSESASISRQAIVKHLQVLAKSGLAVARRDGREVRYFVLANGTNGASIWLADSANAWDRRIAALEKQVRTSSSLRSSSDD